MNPDEFLAKVLENQKLSFDSAEMNALWATRQEVEDLLRFVYGNAPTIRYGGSKAKNTMIRESYDLDMTCYFARDDNQAGNTLEEIYNDVARVLEKNYIVERKRSALRLTSKDPARYKIYLHVDVVPGRFIDGDDGDIFLHQNEGDKYLLKTNLDVHIKHIRGSGVTDAIKLFKLWNVLNAVKVKTFVLELLVVDLLKYHKEKVLITLQAFSDNIAELNVEDPANPIGNDLSDRLDAVRPSLQAAAIQTLSVIEKSGWAMAFKLPEEQTQAEKVKVLQRAAASVASPTKPWWFNE
jgi:hypothetical protein